MRKLRAGDEITSLQMNCEIFLEVEPKSQFLNFQNNVHFNRGFFPAPISPNR
jgi:hypothetical protein